MNCEKSRELFVDYLGEELSQPDRRELKDHLRSCRGCQQELSLLARTKATLRTAWPEEPIPQSLTFEFAPSSPQGFWGRLADFRLPKFVLASLSIAACFVLCLAGLTLLRTQIQIEKGNFKISFGPSAQTSSTVVAAPQNAHNSPVNLTPEAVQIMIDQALGRFEQNQKATLQQALLEAKADLQAKRNVDLERITQEFKYLESTQNVVWKEAVRNNSYLETLARDFYVKASSSGPAQQ